MIAWLITALAWAGGGAVLIGAVGGAALLVVRFWGEKAISARFERELTGYKHDQQKELEHLKFRITGFMDRAVKLHTHEFEVLPEAWARLCDANNQTSSVLSALQSYPDLDRLDREQLEEFLDTTELSKTNKSEVFSADRKTNTYVKIADRRRMANAQIKVQECAFYTQKNGIFMQPAIRDQFDVLEKMLWAALTEKDVGERHEIMPRPLSEQMRYFKEHDDLMKNLHAIVRDRLWNSQSAFTE